ncbi:MAG: aminotransferase class I/II-fold pyridoxal phosphate-dependent enzyme, partial [Candidatus Aminicenantes bacterium]|nr:aminotransferase class I/II-fold pyridoxal phosphate-dependent enzyme [Candidatus Aminicenantes bacterium]
PIDPFDSYFKKRKKEIPSSGPLLKSSSAQRLISSIGWASRSDLYIYQQAFEKKSGPWVYLNGRRYLMISSYDYLGLIGHPAIESAAVEAIHKYGTGTGGVRLLTGTTDLHCLLERELAAFKGTEAALTFSSGYLANLAVISALFGPSDRIIIDSKAHRSIVDACRLSRVPTERFDHNAPSSLKNKLDRGPGGRRTLIIIEGIYSMDGDICPLPEILELKKKYGACLMVDEAHSFGVLGAKGRGVDEHFKVASKDVDIWMGSLSKAIPSNGGFIAGPKDLIYYLQHAASPFIFSAALCPAAVAAAREALRVIEREPERLVKLNNNAVFLRELLKELGYDTGLSESPVIPIILGDQEKTLRLTRKLFALGIIAVPITKPAVSPGGTRIRLCATAAQDEAFLQDIIEGFRKVRISSSVLPKFLMEK